MVTVHHFKVWDVVEGKYVIQPRKSTIERITQIGGVVVPDTGEDVATSALDIEGRFDPRER